MPTTSPRGATQGPRDQRKRPGDLTGVQGQKLAAERDEAQEQEAQDRANAKVQERVEALNTVVDYTEGGVNTSRAEVVESEPEIHPHFMTIRVNYPIEQMTFGREVISPPEYDPASGAVLKPAVLGGMLTYEFEEGKQYRVPWELGAHLKSLGYVYDF
jgi:hypothetical protein